VSHAATFFYTSYLFSVNHRENIYFVGTDRKEIFAIMVLPEEGRWNQETAKEWLRKPDNIEWRHEFTDESYVKWNSETSSHSAYVFRLVKISKEESNSQLVSR